MQTLYFSKETLQRGKLVLVLKLVFIVKFSVKILLGHIPGLVFTNWLSLKVQTHSCTHRDTQSHIQTHDYFHCFNFLVKIIIVKPT